MYMENGVKERWEIDSTGESLDNAWVLRLDDGETACLTWHVESVGGWWEAVEESESVGPRRKDLASRVLWTFSS